MRRRVCKIVLSTDLPKKKTTHTHERNHQAGNKNKSEKEMLSRNGLLNNRINKYRHA